MIIKTLAIVLRTVDYSESSIIATLFTKQHGAIAVIAKGARKPRSKFSAYLVPGQVLEVVYYMKSSRDVQTLSEVSYFLKLDECRTNIEKMALSTTSIELVQQVVHDNEVNEPLFVFLVNLLKWIQTVEEVKKIMFPYIQVRILEHIGIGLQPDERLFHKNVHNGYINITSGLLSEESEGEQSVKLTDKQFYFLKECLLSKKASIFKINIPDHDIVELIEYLDRYIRYHVEGVRPRRSDEIFDQILNTIYEKPR